jgi:hypothetical protein
LPVVYGEVEKKTQTHHNAFGYIVQPNFKAVATSKNIELTEKQPMPFDIAVDNTSARDILPS